MCGDLAAGGRAIDFPIGDLLNPVYSTLNALTQTNQFPQVENESITFLPHNFQETKIVNEEILNVLLIQINLFFKAIN